MHDHSAALPDIDSVEFFTSANRKPAVDAYVRWTSAQLRDTHISPESTFDIIAHVDAMGELPTGSRHLRIIAESTFLRSAREWFEQEPHHYPGIPVVPEVLGDISFLEGEGEAFTNTIHLVGERRKAPGDHAVCFARSEELFNLAAALTRDAMAALGKPEDVEADVAQRTLYEGFMIAHTQSASKRLRAAIRTCSHRILARAPTPPGPGIRAIAPFEEVLAVQATLPDRGLTVAEHEHIAHALRLGGTVLEIRFIDGNAAAACLMNVATLALLVGDTEHARMYITLARALHASNLATIGREEADRTFALLERSA